MQRSGVVFWALFLVLSLPVLCLGDAGVIIPKNIKDKPDPSILSLGHMSVRVRVDGQYARVRVLQIFRNHIKTDVEGRYIFTLPEGSQVSDFAIWEDGVRIPGVVIERKRAREIYEELTYMKIDPGLMETTEEELRNVFSVEIFPIPAYGTKRVEIEYTANLEVTSLQSRFLFPLKPNLYGRQECADFKLELAFDSEFPIRNFRQIGEVMPLQVLSSTPVQVRAEYAAQNIEFKEDFAFEYELDLSESLLSFASFRNPEEVVDLGPFGGGEKYIDVDGYFTASAVYNLQGGNGGERPPKDVVMLVDTSLSMQWDKLERSYEALLFFLRNLPGADRFALVTFNQEVQSFDTKLRSAGEENVAAALEFFRSGYLMGGTDIAGALETVGGFFNDRTEGRERYVILITDGAPTGAEISYARIAESVRESNQGSRAKFMVFGIGGDTNTSLLQRIADDSGGNFVWASETEDLDFKLRTFLDKLGERVITGLGILFGDMSNIDRVYPAGDQRSYDRSMVTFIGRYKQPKTGERITVSGNDGTGPVTLEKQVNLPETATEHDMLPRRWAKLRVDFLLQKIDMAEEGEDVEEMIREIVALAKRYKFVTPYTSFIAAPRALLRPRAIKPGDPVLRVRTDEAIVSVIATFPFGLTKPLHYIEDEDVWETRFLAPKWMRDGTYSCTLLLTDRDGNLYEEDKSFMIDSKPPTLTIRTDKERYRPGDEVVVTVNADSDTRSIQVRFGKLLPVEARYRTALGASRGTVKLPAELPAGTYTLLVTAVDFARNTTVLETPIEVGVKSAQGR
jgi:Ca-activated chloride channel family protein